MQSAAEHSKSNDSKARKLRLVRGPTCILDGRLSMREIPSQSREALEVRFIPLASTCPVAWRYLMRHVSLHPSSFALPLWLRPRSSGHRHMPRQNRLRPVLRSRRKILGAPWRRKMARHSTSLGPLASLARSSVPGATGSPHDGQTMPVSRRSRAAVRIMR